MKKISELEKLIKELTALPIETEWVEFKEAKDNFSFDKLGRYFSALSNEANLKEQPCGWLLLGVKNNRQIVGTRYQISSTLKLNIGDKTTNRITFKEIYEFDTTQGRVVIFEIPAAPRAMPVAWEGHYYGRDGESLVALNLQEIEQIRRQSKESDWSAQICEQATLDDLDPQAINKAKNEFKIKNPKLAHDVGAWNDTTFLNKAKITIQGKITRTAIILLGKPESEHFLSPGVARISWILKDDKNAERDYEHFGPPFIINADEVLNKIRNLKYRFLPDNTLFPTEILQYDPYVIREALHNCIAHQDYELNSRIIVIERPDELIFTNAGCFIPGNVEDVVETDAPQKYYRNTFLAEAMVNSNMIDTIGGGIKKMFQLQKERFLPLPTYSLEKKNEVTVSVAGKMIDENYTKLLMRRPDLDMRTVILLDKVQKNKSIEQQEAKALKEQRLIEGRYPKIFIASQIAALVGDKSRYIKNRGLDKQYYKKLILDLIKEYRSATRKDIDDLLFEKLPNVLNPGQKKIKVNNLLNEMANKERSIKNSGSNRSPKWVLD